MEGTGEGKARRGRKAMLALICLVALLILSALAYAALFGPVNKYGATVEFLVKPGEPLEQIANDLAAQGYVRHPLIFELAFLRETTGTSIRPGGYEISTAMDAWSLASQLTLRPAIAWVTVPVGVRQEQIEDLLTDELGWGAPQRAEWEAAIATAGPNYAEGVYFPDTYLIPTDQPPAQIAARMQDDFKQHFAPYAAEAVKQNVPWTRILTIASLIEREAGSAADMPVIAGVIQKRLQSGMPLAIDATLQYMTGTEGNWWPTPKSAGTYPDSPFNTYKRKGLPPHPIANSSLTAIDAALHPAISNCLFYLHDPKGQIHCSATYKGQLANVEKYLK